MSAAFFDTNILVYAYSRNDVRYPIARRLLDEGGAIGVQCLNEFAAVTTRKRLMTAHVQDEALAIMARLCKPVVALTYGMHRRGMALHRRYQLSIYDAMIVAAALSVKCDTLYSEDMHDGLFIEDRLRIVNPFA